MCENVRHIERDVNETRESYLARLRVRGDEFPCRMCEECARSAEGRIVGDFIAQKQSSQRVLCVLLTYDDAILRAAGRLPGDRESIEVAKEDARLWVVNVRNTMRRMHPDLRVSVKACRVTEMRQLVDGSAGHTVDQWGRWRYKAPTIQSLPRVHHHAALWLSVEWKDAERQSREPAVWRDSLIPRLRTDEWLYHHAFETKAEARKRGGRVRKSSTPWPWGFVSYGEPRGGEGAYFAKYVSKAMRTRQKYKQDKYQNWSRDDLLDFQRSEASWKSFRKSPGLGHDWYKRQGRLQAEAGLPPRLAFQPNLDVAEGGLHKRSVLLPGSVQYIDAHGRLQSEPVRMKVQPQFMLQRVGRQRALLEAYDARRRELFGDAKEPSAPNYRTKRRADGRTVQVIVYGLAEAREAIAKDDDRRYIAKRERQLGRRRRANPGDRELDRLAGKVADELAVAKRRTRVTCSPKAKVTRTDAGALVRSWEAKFEREVLRRLGGEVRTHETESRSYADLNTWLRLQPALCHHSDDFVRGLARQMRERWRTRWLSVLNGGAIWQPWRKGRMKAGTVCG